MKYLMLLLLLFPSVIYATDTNSFIEGVANGLRHSIEAKQGYQTEDYKPLINSAVPIEDPQEYIYHSWHLVDDSGNSIGVYSALGDCQRAVEWSSGPYGCTFR